MNAESFGFGSVVSSSNGLGRAGSRPFFHCSKSHNTRNSIDIPSVRLRPYRANKADVVTATPLGSGAYRRPYASLALVAAALVLVSSCCAFAQTSTIRISGEIDSSATAAIPGSANPQGLSKYDAGRTNAGTALSGITMYFRPSAAQKAELDELVRQQQTAGSTSYHKWLTPAEYAARFGLDDDDLEKVRGWLESQGFTVDRIANSHNSITFLGTVSQVESAFQTEIHNYRVDGQSHYANATELTIPAALSGVVSTIRNLDDFKPKPFVRFHAETTAAKPAFTSSQSGNHYLQPGDVAVIYDIKAAYSAGYTGAGQSVAVVGQSEISVSDIENFQSAAGLTVRDPTLVLVPNSGNAAYSSGDEAESDLDLEYSGGIAKEATLYLVYVGNNSNYSVWDSLQYAVDTDIAPVISMSYGGCEPDLSSSDYSTLESIMEQGASQGQSIVVASGDTGSTACYADLTTNSTPTSQEEELAVNYPASSAFATALGGTEFPSSDVSSSNTTYWESASGSDVIDSALSYIPEQVWNDDSSTYGSRVRRGICAFVRRRRNQHADRQAQLADRRHRDFLRQLSFGAGYFPGFLSQQCRLPLLLQRYLRMELRTGGQLQQRVSRFELELSHGCRRNEFCGSHLCGNAGHHQPEGEFDGTGPGELHPLYARRQLDDLCLGISRHHQRRQRMHRRIELLLLSRRVEVLCDHRLR
jgi:hypothetical protein